MLKDIVGAVLFALFFFVAGTASAASIAVCDGVMNNLLASGNYTARCTQPWVIDDSSYFYIEQMPFIVSRSGDHQNRLALVEARLDELESSVSSTSISAEGRDSLVGAVLGLLLLAFIYKLARKAMEGRR